MNVNNNYPSVVEMEGIYFKKLTFERKEKLSYNNLNVSFEKSIKKPENQDESFQVLLQCAIEDPENTLHLFVSMVGTFRCKATDPALWDTLANENTVSIMFPFLRSQISLMTTQPDMPPIVLPAMNINAIIEQSKRKQKEETPSAE